MTKKELNAKFWAEMPETFKTQVDARAKHIKVHRPNAVPAADYDPSNWCEGACIDEDVTTGDSMLVIYYTWDNSKGMDVDRSTLYDDEEIRDAFTALWNDPRFTDLF